MTNPINSKARGWLYVLGIAIGILATAAGPLEIALHVAADWQAVVTSSVGAIGTLVATLSRANLTPDQPATAPVDAITQALAQSVPVLAKTMATTPAAPVAPDLSSTPVAPTGA